MRGARHGILRAAIATVTAVAIAASLSGCGLVREIIGQYLDGGSGGVLEETNTSTGEEVPPELERFYHQSLSWVWHGRTGETTVTVPLDWSEPEGETIEIAVARTRPPKPSRGMLLINPGGPGGAGYEYGLYGVGVTDAVLREFDIVGFDPRGVGRSTAVECYTDPHDRDELLYATFDDPYGSEGWLAELVERQKNWIEACQDKTGDLLGHLDAGSVARDMDVIRAVLGDDKLDYLGYSYGTFLGTVYAELFPEKVGRMVLDGAVDPDVSDVDWLATQMAGFDSALDAYLTDCLRLNSRCPFSGTPEQAARQVRAILDGITARHLVASDGRVLDEATLGTAIAGALYAEWTWDDLTEAFVDLRRNDPDTAFELADDYNRRYAGFYLSNSSDVYVAVLCNEGDFATDGIGTIEGLEIIERSAPILGRAIALDDYAVLDATCSHWPYPAAELPEAYTAAGAPPIIVIGTTNDPATPYSQAVSLADQLESAVLLTYEGEGHTIYAEGVACIDNAVDAYLLLDIVPREGIRC